MNGTPFDPTIDDVQLEQPSLTMLLQGLVDNAARDLRVCLPCAVARVRGNQLVDLQPLLQARFYASAGPTTLRVIPFCPVSMPSGADYSIKLPIQVGDTGYAIFSDRALSEWLAGDGGVAEPGEDRTHDLTDAIFVPGLYPLAKQTQDATQDLVIRNGTAQVRLEKNGTFRIANQGQELLDLVAQTVQSLAGIVQSLQAAQVLTSMGPSSLWAKTQAELSAQANALQTIKTALGTLQGK